MFELPLFPLHTVLFPGMALPLHIFESRYKQLIKFCLDKDKPFGIVLIRHGSEALGPLPEPHLIGCTARILDVQSLEEGRMKITTIGEGRFLINSIDFELPYLVAQAEHHPFEESNPPALETAAGRISPKVQKYIQLLNEIEEVKIDLDSIPDDPISMASFAATLLQMPPDEKQVLLESRSILDVINSTDKLYLREIAFLRAFIDHGQDEAQTRIIEN
jgi:Lon protease-like protein